MPNYFQSIFISIGLLLFLNFCNFCTTSILAAEGISCFYVRYDLQSSNHKISDSNLLMIPANNEFRAEKFSLMNVAGVISADSKLSQISIEKMIREDSLRSILLKNGLQSVKTKDLDTVISYEGVIITPIKISKTVYNATRNTYSYEAQIDFSPIAFPDRWKTLNMQHKIKKILYNFFELLN